MAGEPDIQLTERERAALLALHRITNGEQAFINVPDADLLVRKGLADLYGKGQYVLTAKGESFLKNWTSRASN
jgi:hypothetical protein